MKIPVLRKIIYFTARTHYQFRHYEELQCEIFCSGHSGL